MALASNMMLGEPLAVGEAVVVPEAVGEGGVPEKEGVVVGVAV
jgi:hypothetical protein